MRQCISCLDVMPDDAFDGDRNTCRTCKGKRRSKRRSRECRVDTARFSEESANPANRPAHRLIEDALEAGPEPPPFEEETSPAQPALGKQQPDGLASAIEATKGIGHQDHTTHRDARILPAPSTETGMINHRQRIAIGVGTLLVVLSGLFPPFEGEYRPGSRQYANYMGYHFLFAPPTKKEVYRVVMEEQPSGDLTLRTASSHIITSRVWVQIVTVVVATVGLCFMLGGKHRGPSSTDPAFGDDR
ncbi:MAG: hypothetical protein A3K19_11775 [Lentisphaerae bacterium RIFOXYB12_FULL_65_16]|nr:MAG: hypothetical protein A3K18_23245 [Lentisphaerae bacterium RIFOXYA12_64_32]OGV87990.1 MAG: hypothetical protein A3K19_11775 [Lentisphaerae bacterium RIFOXYB12_FULL_65_16]